MSHKARLEKLAAGEIRGVRLSRETEWIVQVIATGFLFLGAVVRDALGGVAAAEPTEESVSDSSGGDVAGEPEKRCAGRPLKYPDRAKQ